MIDLYSWNTPNGQKIPIMLEEIQMPYKLHLVNIKENEQFRPSFLHINPNNKIPAIIDQEGPDGKPISIFESAAILIYLADKAKKLLPTEIRQRTETLEWLIFQVAGLGPMLGQAHHFRHYAPNQVLYAIERYTNEAKRLYNVLDKRLSEVEYMATHYSIADIATYPWIAYHERQGINLKDYPYVRSWFEKISARPAVQKGLKIFEQG